MKNTQNGLMEFHLSLVRPHSSNLYSKLNKNERRNIMKTKFLSDGRKVVVIGTLNQQESIVQEIFVTEHGDEVPSGERFVTKSLHDEPVKSWKQREVEKYERIYDDKRKELDSIKGEIHRMGETKAKHAKIIRSNLAIIDQLEDFDFDLLADVVARNVKWAAPTNHAWYRPVAFDDLIIGDSQYGGEGVKLISVHCKQGKSLSYRVNRYSDGSGNYTSYKFFNDDELMGNWLADRMEADFKKGYLSIVILDELSKFIEIPKRISNAVKKEIKDKADAEYKRALDKAKSNRDRMMGVAK